MTNHRKVIYIKLPITMETYLNVIEIINNLKQFTNIFIKNSIILLGYYTYCYTDYRNTLEFLNSL